VNSEQGGNCDLDYTFEQGTTTKLKKKGTLRGGRSRDQFSPEKERRHASLHLSDRTLFFGRFPVFVPHFSAFVCSLALKEEIAQLTHSVKERKKRKEGKIFCLGSVFSLPSTAVKK
jgi:hypothetical protein